MLNVKTISAGFTVKIEGDYPALTPATEREVERIWQAEQKRRGKAMFNGRILSALTVKEEGICGCVAEYRHLIAQRVRPELFDELRIRPVAVSGLFECVDGIVFGRRSGTTTQDAGLWELVPSGGIDTSKTSGPEVDYLSQVLTELTEETGIKADSISSTIPFCLVEDTSSRVVDIGIAIKSSLSAVAILTIHQGAATKEYRELRIVPHAEVSGFINDEAPRIVGVSAMLIQQQEKAGHG